MYFIIIILSILLIIGIILYSKYKNNRRNVLVLKNYNDESGFFWQIHNGLHTLNEAEINGQIPIFEFDSGLYLSEKSKDNNWFNDFFEPIGKRKITDKIQYFTRESFERRIPMYKYDYNRIWKTYIKIRPEIQNEVNAFINENFSGKKMLGIHYRGTDKFQAYDSSEDYPIHYEYEFCQKLIDEWVETNKSEQTSIGIFVCSDEQPFVDYICSETFKKHGIKPSTTNSVRSSISTSGWNLESEKCVPGSEYEKNSENCKKYREMRDMSIHKGMKNVSNYDKGKQVLIDVLLLSNCDTFFRSQGNVSNFPEYLNPNLNIVYMNEKYMNSKK